MIAMRPDLRPLPPDKADIPLGSDGNGRYPNFTFGVFVNTRHSLSKVFLDHRKGDL